MATRAGRLLPLVLVAATVWGSCAAAAAASTGDPKQYVLQVGDLPTGFAEVASFYRAAEDAAYQSPISVTRYRAWGFSRGYEAVYAPAHPRPTPAHVGRPEIFSVADLYDSVIGAERSLSAHAATCGKPPFSRLGLSGFDVGEAEALCRVSAGAEEAYVLYWRRGPVVASVVIVGTAGGAPPGHQLGLAEKLARVEDGRIASAG